MLKVLDLRSNLKVFTGIKKKNKKKKFFQLGQNLCFSILKIQKSVFTRQFFTRSGIDQNGAVVRGQRTYPEVPLLTADVSVPIRSLWDVVGPS